MINCDGCQLSPSVNEDNYEEKMKKKRRRGRSKRRRMSCPNRTKLTTSLFLTFSCNLSVF